MKALLSILLGCSMISFGQPLRAQVNEKGSFSIITFGDMPYALPEDYTRFENLIKTVNAQDHAFSVHVGDIKSSSTPCSDEYFQKIRDYFGQFRKPLVYTPGDNEWTDCGKVTAGGYDPEERLSALRKAFFLDNRSFGKEKLVTIPQSQGDVFSKFVENRRWDFGGVTFGTVHLVGSNNNFLPDSKNFNREFFERNEANMAWLKVIFAHAVESRSAGIFLFTQADMFSRDKASSGCFERFLTELKKLTTAFGRPVVLVNGDSHKFIVDKPFLREDKSGKVLENFTRIQVFGEDDMQAVRMVISPASSELFNVQQLLIPGN